MGIIILAVIFLIIGVVGIGAAILSKDARVLGVIVGGVATLAAVATLFFGSLATVGTSDVGVESSFGHLTGDLAPGPHLVAPWVSVTNWDDSVQVVTYGRDQDQSKPDHCLLVRIGGGQSACLTLTFAYHVRPSAADDLYRAYRGNQARMNSFLVVRTLDSALNTRLETFSPIEALAASSKGGAPTATNTKAEGAAALSPYARLVENDLKHLIGSDIVVQAHSLVIPYVTFDPQTQARLNRYQGSIADYFTAVENEKTAQAQAAANKTLQASVSGDPDVVAYYCMTHIAAEMVQNGQNPAGFNCWAGSGGSSVVVPKG
jgi:hypothetical protein